MVITTVQSLRAARRVLDEIASSGGWRASGNGEHSVIYRKGEEELLVLREDTKVWKVIRQKEGEDANA